MVRKNCWTKLPRWSLKVPESTELASSGEHTPRVLIMRPAPQAEPLVSACRSRGLEPVPLPTLMIEGVVQPDERDYAPRQGLAVFTSTNAVVHAKNLGKALPWPQVLAIGIGTATHKALVQTGQTIAGPPVAPFTSEALVQRLIDDPHTAMQAGVSIVTGENSRSILSERLMEGGFKVQTLPVYRRVLPPYSMGVVSDILDPLPDIIVVPSNQALDNLLSLAATEAASLRTRPVIVNSQRAAEHASVRGFTGDILVAQIAGDKGQLQVLDAWLQTQVRVKHR